MKTNVFDIVHEEREQTPEELREKFLSVGHYIVKATSTLRECLMDRNTFSEDMDYFQALCELDPIINHLNSLRHILQSWANQEEEEFLTKIQESPRYILANADMLLNITQVAEYLGCNRSTVYRKHLKNGLMTQQEPNGTKKVRVEDLIDYKHQLNEEEERKAA